MKMNLFCSNTTKTSTNKLIDFLSEQNTCLDINHIVIVPDRFTLSTERDIYERMNLNGSFNIDVTSFSRLAARINKHNKKFLSKEGTVMLLKKVIDENVKNLGYFNKIKISIGFAKEIFAVIASFRLSGITPESLKKISEGFDGLRRLKYADLAFIYNEYENALKNRYQDTITRIEGVTDLIADNEWINNSHIYVAGFNIFSELQIKILKTLCINSLSLNIAASTDSGGSNREIFPSVQIEEIAKFAIDNKVELSRDYYFERLKQPFDFINKELFSFARHNKKAPKTDNVYLFSSKNPYEEVRSIGKEIAYLVREKGLRFKDISVVCCQDDYKKCFTDIFARMNIPFFIDHKYSAAKSILAKFLSAIMEINIHNFRIDKVLNLIKHPYYGLKRKEIERFENYCLKYNINYSRFTSSFTLGDFDENEKIRKRIMKSVSVIPKREKTENIANIIISECEKDFTQLDEINDNYFLASNQCNDKIVSLVNEIKEIIGNKVIDLEEFYSVFWEGVNNLQIALIPQYQDCVFIGNTMESRFSNVKALFVAGGNEGFFPIKSGEQTIISLVDLHIFQKNGIKIRPNPMENNSLEKFVITDLLCKAERLYVSCSFYNILGEPLLYSETIKELSNMLNIPIDNRIQHKEMSEEEYLLYNLVSAKNAFYEYIRGNTPQKFSGCIREFLIQNGYQNELNRIEKRENKKPDDFIDYFFSKDKEKNFTTKVTQLESYFKCPYMHYLRYGLKLKEREVAELKVADIGNIIHNILEIYFKYNLHSLREMSERDIYNNSVKAIEKVLSEEKVVAITNDKLGENIIRNIYNECIFILNKLTTNIKNSSFSPKYIELEFNDENKDFKAIVLDTPKGVFKMKGKIDRVDTFEEKSKVAIIDYKTGNSEQDKFKYIYYGKKIQLYVYLKVFIEKEYKPAGVFYLPLADGYRTTKDRFRFKGQFENSLDTVYEFDNLLFDKDRYNGEKVDSDILSISASMKKGEIALNKCDNKIDRADFYNICRYVDKLVIKAIDEISEGNIAKLPLDEECKYCIYKNHCNVNEITQRNTLRTKIDSFRAEGEND